jgi:serine O-acetyltransferase
MVISATEPDWSRERKVILEWDPGKSLLAAIRQYHRWRNKPGPIATLMRGIAVFRHRFWSMATGSDIAITAQIGGGLALPHPQGVIIHADAVIGVNCLIFQGVTLGIVIDKPPTIEGQVDIGAGAKILGEVRIGAHAKIGANAVVLKDVPSGCTAVGIPARVISGTRS